MESSRKSAQRDFQRINLTELRINSKKQQILDHSLKFARKASELLRDWFTPKHPVEQSFDVL